MIDNWRWALRDAKTKQEKHTPFEVTEPNWGTGTVWGGRPRREHESHYSVGQVRVDFGPGKGEQTYFAEHFGLEWAKVPM